MSPSQRCDEVLRLIDETLSDHPTPSVEGVDSGANRPSADASTPSPLPVAPTTTCSELCGPATIDNPVVERGPLEDRAT